MSHRKVYVPGYERYVTLGQYVEAVKTAKAHPGTEFKHGLTCWWSVTGEEVVRQFVEGMQARISEGIPYSQRGIAV